MRSLRECVSERGDFCGSRVFCPCGCGSLCGLRIVCENLSCWMYFCGRAGGRSMSSLKRKPWYQYLWIWSILYFSLGFFNILFAWLGMIDFLLPLIFAAVGGNKWFCNNMCGRGQLFNLLGSSLHLSRNKRLRAPSAQNGSATDSLCSSLPCSGIWSFRHGWWGRAHRTFGRRSSCSGRSGCRGNGHTRRGFFPKASIGWYNSVTDFTASCLLPRLSG